MVGEGGAASDPQHGEPEETGPGGGGEQGHQDPHPGRLLQPGPSGGTPMVHTHHPEAPATQHSSSGTVHTVLHKFFL